MARTRRSPAGRSAQLRYAALLSDAGRRGEAISLLLSMIEQHGDDPAVGKKAADMVKAIGSPQQVEQAYAALASHYPADASVWLRLGDARFAAEEDVPALDAYRFAAKADPGNADTGHAVARVEEILRLDPTRRGLSVRERARRWDEILQRVLDRRCCLWAISGDREGKAATEEAVGQASKCPIRRCRQLSASGRLPRLPARQTLY